MAIEFEYEAVVIGSGFGGSISTCRLSKKWPGKIMLLERGKRYPMGSFPRKPHDVARNFWNLNREQRQRPHHVAKKDMRGLFDIRHFKHLDTVVAAGLGGGSLIYANVFLEPPEQVFEEGWPTSLTKASLQPYYQVSKKVLGARPIPQNDDPRRKIIRTELFQQVAQAEGRDSTLLDINVFFGKDFDNPTAIGLQEENQYGAIQTSCTYCAECDVGCNTHSKNTLDLNYLFVAETRYQANIQTEVLAEKIVPLNEASEDDTTATGEFGYRVYYLDLKNNKVEKIVTTRRVIVSAGTLGTNELLMRCRDHYRTLPHINHHLGKHFSANGDFLSFVIDSEEPADPNYGPVITQGTDYNLFKDFNRENAFILEDAGYPSFLSWYVEGIKPGLFHFKSLINSLKVIIGRLFRGQTTGRMGYAFTELMKGDASFKSCVLLCMGLDKSTGKMYLDENGFIGVDWPYKDNLSLYEAILATGEKFRQHVGGKLFVPLINWLRPARNNVTVHSLGGCRLADSEALGVTSADPKTMGQVFGYQGLYVADGALFPTAVGANPVATISALSEKVAEGITGITPNANL